MEVASVEVELTPESVFAEAAEATGWHLLRFDYGKAWVNGLTESYTIPVRSRSSRQEQEEIIGQLSFGIPFSSYFE